jgi:hypothetical protein
MPDVRFTPESGHSWDSRKESVNDCHPKRTLASIMEISGFVVGLPSLTQMICDKQVENSIYEYQGNIKISI